MKAKWTLVSDDSGHFFIYSPNFNRLYHITKAQSKDFSLRSVLGLKRFHFKEKLEDPADKVLHSLSQLSRNSVSTSKVRYRMMYKIFHYSRYFVPLTILLHIIKFFAERSTIQENESLTRISQQILAIERKIRFSSCYPRALMTAYLLLKNGYNCDFVIGILAPTRLMHAWCCTGGVIPYESVTQHFIYQPLISIDLNQTA